MVVALTEQTDTKKRYPFQDMKQIVPKLYVIVDVGQSGRKRNITKRWGEEGMKGRQLAREKEEYGGEMWCVKAFISFFRQGQIKLCKRLTRCHAITSVGHPRGF